MKYDILDKLKDGQGNVSGEKISKEMGISRAMVWKVIRALRKEGYKIGASPRKGYFLEKDSDILNEHELGNGILDGQIIFFEEIDSTNTYLKEHAEKDQLSEGTCVVCNRQLKGRGRLGREWYSQDNKNIAMSVLLRPAVNPNDAQGFALLTGICVYEVLTGYVDKKLMIKWPNDIMIDNKKVCGILTEMTSEIDQINCLIIGIGINVHSRREKIITEITGIATTIEDELIDKTIKLDRAKIIRTLLDKIENEYTKNRNGLNKEVIEKWKKYSGAEGKKIEYVVSNEKKIGIITDVDKTGALIVKSGNEIDMVSSGMIFEIEGHERRKSDG